MKRFPLPSYGNFVGLCVQILTVRVSDVIRCGSVGKTLGWAVFKLSLGKWLANRNVLRYVQILFGC